MQVAARLSRCLGGDLPSTWKLKDVVESKYFTLTMLAVVLSNTVVMIFETFDVYYQRYHSFFLLSERIFLCIYIVECCLKLWVHSWRFFRTLWNCFDLFIIVISVIDLITQQVTHDTTHSSLQIDHNQQIQTQFERINHFLKILRVLRVLRSVRALRVLRTIRFIGPIHTIVQTCAKALPSMASITFVMIIITCISAIIARSLFGDICPDKFDNLVKTFFSLFTLLTLDDWYSIYQVCAERDYSTFQLIFCLVYVFILNFILLNLLMAVLVDSFQHTLNDDAEKTGLSKSGNEIDRRVMNNLTKLAEEYCVETPDTTENTNEQPRNESLFRIETIMKKYYMLMESSEFHMERHEQLTKLTQKLMQLTLIEQENRKVSTKK